MSVEGNHPNISGKSVFFIGLSYFVVFIGQSIWRSTVQNLAIEMYEITPVQMGLAFSLVAIPGLFSALLGFIGAKIKLLFLLSSA